MPHICPESIKNISFITCMLLVSSRSYVGCMRYPSYSKLHANLLLHTAYITNYSVGNIEDV